MSKLYPLENKNKTNIFCVYENILLYFLGTKIQICYIFRDKLN